MMRTKIVLLVAISLFAGVWAQIHLPKTGLTISYSSVGIKGILDDWWYTEAVVCSTETGCVDVIFVVDTSGSMSDKISELYTEIGEFAYSARLRSRTVARLVGKIEFDDGKIYAH